VSRTDVPDTIDNIINRDTTGITDKRTSWTSLIIRIKDITGIKNTTVADITDATIIIAIMDIIPRHHPNTQNQRPTTHNPQEIMGITEITNLKWSNKHFSVSKKIDKYRNPVPYSCTYCYEYLWSDPIYFRTKDHMGLYIGPEAFWPSPK
jgi:hypothetical protein